MEPDRQSSVNPNNSQPTNAFENPAYSMDDQPATNGRRRSHAFSFKDSHLFTVALAGDNTASRKTQEVLVSTQLRLFEPRNFYSEIRGLRDVQAFVNDAYVLLDCKESCLKDLIDKVLRMFFSREKNHTVLEEARKTLLAHPNYELLANKVQGVNIKSNGQYHYDQTWLCAFCSISSLSKRRVAIVRLKQPTNLGTTSQDVRFFILILSPVNEKTTKNSEEAARTFATLLADGTFRLALQTGIRN